MSPLTLDGTPNSMKIFLLVAACAWPLLDEDGTFVEQAVVMRSEGRVIETMNFLQDVLGRRLASSDEWQGDAPIQAELEALMLLDVAVGLTAWSESLAFLDRVSDSLEAAPTRVRFLLRYLEGEALRGSGQVDRARKLFAELGYVDDWQIIGPFDNERGSGYRRSLAPEEGIDLEQVLPGKERDVRWRPNPARNHPLKRLSLAALFVPSEQVVAYLATALESTEARDLVLRLGTSAPFRVFLNGSEIAARDVERPRFADQDRVLLRLGPGWNELLVKLAVEEGAWSFEARLTDLDGQPARSCRIDSTRLGRLSAPTPDAPQPGQDQRPSLPPDTREWLEARPDQAWAQRALALYHLIVHPDDWTSEADLAAARRAVALEPESILSRYLLARSLEPEGQERTEMAIAPFVDALESVLELDPDNVSALLRLTEVFTDLDPLPDRVEELTHRALESAPLLWSAARARARHLSAWGRSSQAQVLLDRVSETPSGRLSPAAASVRAERLLARGELEAGLAQLTEEIQRSHTSLAQAEWALRLLVDRGRLEEAEQLVTQVLASVPYADDLRRTAARLFEYAGRPQAARGWIERSLELRPESREALRALARLEERGGDLAAAGRVLELLLELDPGSDTVRRRLRQLRQDSQTEEDFETPWRRDAIELVGLPLDENLQGEALEVLDRCVVWHVHADGAESRYEHLVVRVLSRAGVQAFDHFPIVYPPGGSLKVHTVRVLKADGSRVRAPTPASDRSRGGSYARVFDLPPLSVGDVIDVEYRVDETEPDVFGEYFGTRHTFYPDQIGDMACTRRSELVILSPPGVELHVAERNTENLQRGESVDEQGRSVLRFLARDLQRPALEGFMPQRAELAPVVDVTTYESWDAFGEWWWNFIAKEFDTSPDMERKVRELTEGLTTEDQKVAAILRFVAQEIRYNAWPFGTHGYEPFSASTIFERRFGDCKDKSILLRQMLSMIDVEALPVLVRAQWRRSKEPLAAAMVEHFNHCIAYITPTSEREGYWLDATADHNPIDYLRADVQGARVLHVGPRGTELHEIPYAPPAANVRARRFELQLAADATAMVELVDESCGNFGVMLRHRYAGEQGDLEDHLADDLNDLFGAVEFESIETSDLEDTHTPARLEARFACRDLGAPDGDGLALPLALEALGLESMAVEAPDERVHELVLDRPFAIETVIRWTLPPGSVLKRKPQDTQLEAPGMLRYEATVTEFEGGFEVHRRFELLRRRIPVQEYAAFHRVLQDVRQADARTLTVAFPETEKH